MTSEPVVLPPSNWRAVRVGEVVTLQRGFDITKAEQSDGPYAVISSSGPTSYHSTYKVHGPGVVIGRKGSLGGVFFSTAEFWPHDTTLWVQDFHGNDPRFVYYWLQTLGLGRYDVGASNPTLNRNHVHLLPTSVPEVVTQRKIARILSAYDVLIENNNRRIRIVEEMAQTIYREWFVEFRYPGHEGVPLVDSELGPIPEGWEVRALEDLVTTQYGYTESASTDLIGPKFLRGMDINKKSYIDWAGVPYCSIDSERLAQFQLNRGDIVIIRMADPGKVGIVERDIEAVFASYLVRLQPHDVATCQPYWLFHFLSSANYQDYVRGATTGTTRGSVSAKVMTAVRVVVPPGGVQGQFVDMVASLRAMMATLVEANENLRTSRDLLLPRLISGEIDVSDLDIDTSGLVA